MQTSNTPCNPCNDCIDPCAEPVIDKTCSVKLDTSCILYNIVTGTPSLLTGINLPNGATLTQILEAFDAKLNGLTGYNTSTFNITYLRNEYNITDLKSIIEALANKLYGTISTINSLQNNFTTLSSQINQINSVLNNPTINNLYNTIIDEGDSIEEIITKIINYLGEKEDNGINGSSPNLFTVNTNSIAFATSGAQNHTLTANVVIAPDAGNLLKLRANGLYVEPVKQTISFDPITRKVCLSNDGGCFILPKDQSDNNETTLVAINSNTVEFVTSGTKGHTITANVNVQSILNQITTNLALKELFCNICIDSPCDGQPIAAQWQDTGETRCKTTGFDLEKKQKDNNICSPTYNTYRWVVAQANSILCGFKNINYCIQYNCSTKACQSTDTTNCQSVQVCLRDNVTGQLLQAPEDISIFYQYKVEGSTKQYSFILDKGLVSAEGSCHCTPKTATQGIISNVEVVGQENDNSEKGYIVCGQVQTPTTPSTTNSAVLTGSCAYNSMTVQGHLTANGTRGIRLFKDGIKLDETTANVGADFTIAFGNVTVNGNYTAEVYEIGNETNKAVSNLVVLSCVAVTPTTPNSAVLTSDCNSHTVNISGSLQAGTIVLQLIKDGTIIDSKNNIVGPTFNATFNVTTNGVYFVRALELNNDTNKVSSNVINISCNVVTPTPTPTPIPTPAPNPVSQSTINITPNCSNNSATVTGTLSGVSRIIVKLFKNDAIQEVKEIVGPNFTTQFNNITSGNYFAKVSEVNVDSNSVTSMTVMVNCVPEEPIAPQQPNAISISNDCNGKTITVDVTINNGAGFAINLYKDNVIYKSVDTLTGNKAIYTFNNIVENGDYYVRVFERNNDNNFLQSGVVNMSCNTAPVTPPAACTRPTGLTTYRLAFNYVQIQGGNAATFVSMAEACQKANSYYSNTGVASLPSFVAQAANLNVGTQFYLNNDTDCDTISSNIYYVEDKDGNDLVKKAITVSNTGIIVGMLDCTTITNPTPSPTPSPTPTPAPTPTTNTLGVVTINQHYSHVPGYTYTDANWDQRWTNGRDPAYYYSLRMQFKTGIYANQSSLSNHYDTSQRYVGGTSANDAVMVASYDSIPYPNNPPSKVYNRFMISCTRLRERGYTGIVEIDIYSKRILGSDSIGDSFRIGLGSYGTGAGDIVQTPAKKGYDFYISGTPTGTADDTFSYYDAKNPILNTEVKVAVAKINLDTNKVTIESI